MYSGYWTWHKAAILNDLINKENEDIVYEMLMNMETDNIDDERLNPLALAVTKLESLGENKIIEKWIVPYLEENPIFLDDYLTWN